MSQVFLSYARNDDEPFVKQLYEDLSKNGIKVWWDREKMESRGRTFLQELRDAIEESDRLIAVIGPSAVVSDYVRVEWEYALNFPKVVVPILRIGDNNLIPSEFPKVHCLDFRKERQYNVALKELLRILEDPLPQLGQFLTSIPSLPPNYLTRRECLDKLNKLMMDDIQRPIITKSTKHITALQGMGGTGKSVLAAAFIRTSGVRWAFNDGILWVTIGSEKPDSISGMKLIGTKLGDDPANYSSLKEAEASLSKVLSDKVCLIVLDDVWKVPHVMPFVNALGPRCRLLITTRNEDIITSLGAHECKIEMLNESDSIKLMAEWCEKDANSLPAEAKGVAKECGYLPLALSSCGAMAKNGITWSSILEALQEADLEYIETRLPNYPSIDKTEDTSVMKVLKVSVDFLSGEEPKAVQLYQELAIFPKNEFVPEAAITTLWTYNGNLKKRNIDKLLTKLKDWSLLQLGGEAPNRLISLHDLQLDYLRATADDLLYLHNQLLEAYSKECGNKWSAGPKDGYFFEHLAHHLVVAGRKEELRKLLLDFSWMQSKLDATDVHFLIKDYEFFSEDYPVEMVKGAIQLSANALSKDKKQLDGQLLGRLDLFSETEIKLLLGHIRKHKNGMRILPLTGSLTPPGGPLLLTLERISDTDNSVCVTSDGNYAISSSSDYTLKVWDLRTGNEVRTLKGHSFPISAVCVTSDGNYAISASFDGTLKIWDIKTGKEVHTSISHSNFVRAICVTPDGNYAISASYDGTLGIWDLKTGKELRTIEGHSFPVSADYVTPVGDHAYVTPSGTHVFSTSSDGTLEIWDLKKGKESRTLKYLPCPFSAVCVTSDGNYAISASNSKTLNVYYLNTGEKIRTLIGHSYLVRAVCITPDGKCAVSASSDYTLKVWDIKTGNEVRTLIGHLGSVNAVCVTSDGNYAISASNDRTLKVWDLKKGKEIRTLTGHSHYVRAIFVTSDGNYAISVSSDFTLKVWNIKIGEEVRTLTGHSYPVFAVSVTPNGDYAISASSDSTLKVWNIKTGTEIHTLTGHSGSVNSVFITPEGNCAVSASNDRTLKVWDLNKGKEIRTLTGHSHFVRAVSITPDGNYAVSASDDGKLKVWDIETGKEIRTLLSQYSGPENAISITPDGKYVVSASDNGMLKVWNLKTGKEVRTWIVDSKPLYAVCITSDGNYAISASFDYTLKVWDIKTSKNIKTLTGHSDWINGISVTHDGNYVISASSDYTLKVWDLRTGKEVSAFYGDSQISSVVFSPDGNIIVAGEESGRVHFLLFERGSEIENKH